MNLLKKLFLSILSVEDNINLKDIKNEMQSKRRKYFKEGCTLSIDALAESEKEQMETEISLIFKSSKFDPVEVLKYVELHNTKVFYLNNISILKLLGESEGFIYPQIGLKAIILSLLTNKVPFCSVI